MLIIDRRQAMMDYLNEKHSATISELSKKFFISETSVRRDLTRLEKAGYVRRSYGGVSLLQSENKLLSLEARKETEKEEKNIIAGKAVRLIHEDDILFLDSSSTALAIVPHLAGFKSLTVITNGAKIATALVDLPNIHVYGSGGHLSPNVYSYNGPIAHQMLCGMHANLFFVSPKGVDMHRGIYCTDGDETAVRRVMMEHSDHTCLLCNYNKLGRSAAFRLCGLNEIHAIVCDRVPEDDWRNCFGRYGIQVI